jgi:hemoglobin/transferrin/lactoferrin receptor protein
MKRLIFTNLVLIFCLHLTGQEKDFITKGDTLFPPSLAEVVVTANRFNSIGIETPEAIRSLETISVQKFQLRTAPEALQLTPGVFIQKTNHGGGSPFIRGLTGNQTLILIDGIRLSNSTMRYGPNQYFNTIDIFSIGKIEVLRGSGSVQYGSDALGGTIQAFTSAPDFSDENKFGSTLLTRIGTRGMEQSFRGGVSYTNKNAAINGGLTWRNFGDLVGGDTTGIQSPSGYDELDQDFKARFRISPKTEITAVFQNVSQRNIPIYHKVVLEDYAINRTDPQKRQLAYLRLNQVIGKGIFESASLTASWQKTGEGRDMRKNGSDLLRTESDRVRTLGFSAEGLLSSGDFWTGNIGLEVYNDHVKSSRTDKDLLSGLETEKRGLYPDGSLMTSLAAFTVQAIDLEKWNFTAGARFNTYVIKVDDEESGTTKLNPSAIVANLAVMRKLNQHSNLFASVNTGFRSPNIDDLGTLGIVDFRYETPNFNLKPESSIQYQAGYKYQDTKLRGEIFLYKIDMYNLIVRKRIEDQVIEGYPVYQKENSERAYIQGVETAWDYSISRSVSINSSLTWTYGQNISKDEPLRRIPPLFGHLSVDYRFRDLWVNLEWLSTGKQERLAQGDKEDNRIPDGGTPGWNLLNLNTGYGWKFFKADVSLKNIFNKDYRYHGSGINGLGRSLFITLAVNF